MKEDEWVLDNEQTRSYDGKKLFIKGLGVFLMHVREINSKGERRKRYVQLLIEPYDLDAAMSTMEVRNDTGTIQNPLRRLE